MLEASATPLIASTFVLLLILCIWWLVVEWGFKRPAGDTSQLKHSNDDGAIEAGQNKPAVTQPVHKRGTHNDQSRIGQTRADQTCTGQTSMDDTHPGQKKIKPAKLDQSDTSHSTAVDSGCKDSGTATAKKSTAEKTTTKNVSDNLKPKTNSPEYSTSQTTAGAPAASSSKGAALQQAATGKTTHAVKPLTAATDHHGKSKAEHKATTAKENAGQASREIAVQNNKTRNGEKLTQSASVSADRSLHRKSHKTEHSQQSSGADQKGVHKQSAQANSGTTKQPPINPQKAVSGASASNPNSPNNTAPEISRNKFTAPEKTVKKESKQTGTANKKSSSAQPMKYQTAAKTQSPSVRSEASIQIQTNKAPSQENRANSPLHAILNLDSSPRANSKTATLAVTSDSTDTSSLTKNKRKDKTNKKITDSAATSGVTDNPKNTAANVAKDGATTGTTHSAQANTANHAQTVVKTPVQSTATLSIAANREQSPGSPKLKSVPNTSGATHAVSINKTDTNPTGTRSETTNNNSNLRKQSPIERVMARQTDQQLNVSKDDASVSQASPADVSAEAKKPVATESQAADEQAGAEQSIHGDTALRAQLASSERRIKSLQSTLNNLQQDQSQAATTAPVPTPAQAAGSHTRPTLMSKVRILDAPRG